MAYALLRPAPPTVLTPLMPGAVAPTKKASAIELLNSPAYLAAGVGTEAAYMAGSRWRRRWRGGGRRGKLFPSPSPLPLRSPPSPSSSSHGGGLGLRGRGGIGVGTGSAGAAGSSGGGGMAASAAVSAAAVSAAV